MNVHVRFAQISNLLILLYTVPIEMLRLHASVLKGSSIATSYQTILYRKSAEQAGFLPGSQDISNFLGVNLWIHDIRYVRSH